MTLRRSKTGRQGLIAAAEATHEVMPRGHRRSLAGVLASKAERHPVDESWDALRRAA